VIITSNRTREFDALKRPASITGSITVLEKELRIVTLRVPNAPARLARQLVQFVQSLRTLELYKVPGVAETIDWAEALVTLDMQELDLPGVQDTLGVLLKYQDDIDVIRRGDLKQLVLQARGQLEIEARL
jgi:hypothetical protein